MNKHSPGPWEYHATEDWVAGSPDGAYNIVANGPIARVGDICNEEATIANARLIAAAPDLLAAVEVALALMEGEGLDELHGDVAEVLRDVIEQATSAA